MSEDVGHGRIGHLEHTLTLEQLVVRLVEVLPFTARGVSTSGYPDFQVSKVALCAGAGDSFLGVAADAGVDVYITSDLRHHPVSDASTSQRPLAVIDISHWAAESLWLDEARRALEEHHRDVEFIVSELVTDPWSFVINRENDEG